MAEISDESNRIIPAEPPRTCWYCAEEIKPKAIGCHHCSAVQAGLFRFSHYIRVPDLVSLGLLILSFVNVSITRGQLTEARAAGAKAEAASKKVETMETRVAAAFDNVFRMEQTVLVARHDVCNVAQSLADVAELIPRRHEGGAFDAGSLPEKDKAFLKEKIAALRKQVRDCS